MNNIFKGKKKPISFQEEGFHGDKYLQEIANYCIQMSSYFVETGSNIGNTFAYVASNTNIDCFSCEPDKAYYKEAKKRIKGIKHAKIYSKGSPQFLYYLHKEMPKVFQYNCTFWIDSHGNGFQWPLKEEIAFITEEAQNAFILIDDFLVPGHNQFGYDQYDNQVCSLEYIKNHIHSNVSIIFPSYSERTSMFHPLRGWVLLVKGFDENFINELLNRFDYTFKYEI